MPKKSLKQIQKELLKQIQKELEELKTLRSETIGNSRAINGQLENPYLVLDKKDLEYVEDKLSEILEFLLQKKDEQDES